MEPKELYPFKSSRDGSWSCSRGAYEGTIDPREDDGYAWQVVQCDGEQCKLLKRGKASTLSGAMQSVRDVLQDQTT